MARDPHLPRVGQLIRFTTRTAQRGWLEDVEVVGRVTCIWENGWADPHISTDVGTCIPALGDRWHAEPDLSETEAISILLGVSDGA